ncbi:RNA polymerase sigma factor [Planctomycetes bacterium Pla163]|uniref:RNA polymerase sigma factor n=1 Tax=Rohdeia mirabilis TaxID=2528008 RepID=A0A518CUS4_9BACT|nr:RNA polymerase sigma factor [Planctomycetes bacterium Pla163]
MFRAEYGALLAALARRTGGDLIAAEDALSEAFAAATEQWTANGVPDVPDVPAAWVLGVARRRLVDGARRARAVVDGHERAHAIETRAEDEVDHEFLLAKDSLPTDDDRLRLVFTCCHPALEIDARIALTLNTLGGLRAHEIARAFLVGDATMAQRLVRAKTKIRAAGIPFAVPPEDVVPERLAAVLRVVYLIFNAGNGAGAGDGVERQGLVRDALRLARLLVEMLPDDGEVAGLLALLLLTDARSMARTDTSGELVLLPDQDRSLWDRDLIDAGRREVERALVLSSGAPGPYALQAAIAAVHADAERASDTDWAQIVALYEVLERVEPTPVVALNHAVAVAEIDGPAAGLARVDALEAAGELDRYLYLHATRADLLRRLGRPADARAAYSRAIELADDPVERRFLVRRVAELDRE